MSKNLQSRLGLIDARTVAGFARDADKPGRALVVELLADGVPFAAAIADRYSPALAAEGTGDARHGFVFALPERLAATTRVLSARLANLKTAVGKPLDLEHAPKLDVSLAAPGAVEAVNGLIISGWVKASPGAAMLLAARVGGEEVAATITRTWNSRTIGGEERPVLNFQLQLPPVLADGRQHLVEVTTANGNVLAGSPVKFQARAVQKPKA